MKKNYSLHFPYSHSTFFQNLELSYCIDDEQIIRHIGYALQYNEQYEQAEWVAYQLTAAEVNGKYERSDNFRKGPHVSTEFATFLDYIGSGYNRGHNGWYRFKTFHN